MVEATSVSICSYGENLFIDILDIGSLIDISLALYVSYA